MISINTSLKKVPMTLNFYDDCIGIQKIKLYEQEDETKVPYRAFMGVSFEEKMSGNGLFKLIGLNGVNVFEVGRAYLSLARQAREFVTKRLFQ